MRSRKLVSLKPAESGPAVGPGELVGARGREDSDKTDRAPSRPQLVWLSMWWEPTEEDHIYKLAQDTAFLNDHPSLRGILLPKGI